MPVALELYTDPDYTVTTVLDGRAYDLRFMVNTRVKAGESQWWLHVYTSEGDPIINGVRVVLNTALGARCTDPRFWPGMLIAFDSGDNDVEPRLEDLGTRVQLYYYSISEAPPKTTGAVSALATSNLPESSFSTAGG